VTVTFDLLDGSRAGALAADLRELYAEVYAESPYEEGPAHVARFAEHLAEQLDRPGFVLASATDVPALVGVAYGWTMAPGQWFSSAIDQPPEEIRSAAKFAVMEWMVRAPYRQGGVGRRLLDLVLTGRHEPYAILASNPAAPARQVYDRFGWRQCGTTQPDLLPPMDVLALPVNPRTPA
jgi:hypothetical protein